MPGCSSAITLALRPRWCSGQCRRVESLTGSPPRVVWVPCRDLRQPPETPRGGQNSSTPSRPRRRLPSSSGARAPDQTKTSSGVVPRALKGGGPSRVGVLSASGAVDPKRPARTPSARSYALAIAPCPSTSRLPHRGLPASPSPASSAPSPSPPERGFHDRLSAHPRHRAPPDSRSRIPAAVCGARPTAPCHRRSSPGVDELCATFDFDPAVRSPRRSHCRRAVRSLLAHHHHRHRQRRLGASRERRERRGHPQRGRQQHLDSHPALTPAPRRTLRGAHQRCTTAVRTSPRTRWCRSPRQRPFHLVRGQSAKSTTHYCY